MLQLILTVATIAVVAAASQTATRWGVWKKIALGAIFFFLTRVLILFVNVGLAAQYASNPYGIRSPTNDEIMSGYAMMVAVDLVILGVSYLASRWAYGKLGGGVRESAEDELPASSARIRAWWFSRARWHRWALLAVVIVPLLSAYTWFAFAEQLGPTEQPRQLGPTNYQHTLSPEYSALNCSSDVDFKLVLPSGWEPHTSGCDLVFFIHESEDANVAVGFFAMPEGEANPAVAAGEYVAFLGLSVGQFLDVNSTGATTLTDVEIGVRNGQPIATQRWTSKYDGECRLEGRTVSVFPESWSDNPETRNVVEFTAATCVEAADAFAGELGEVEASFRVLTPQ